MSKYEMAVEIAAFLTVAPPLKDFTPAELDCWIDWYSESFGAAKAMTAEAQSYLKQGGWWPPSTARMISEPAPEVVCLSRLGR